MKRLMTSVKNPEIKYTVHAHIILGNFWEYYLTSLPDENGIFSAFVIGFDNEHGDVSLDDIKPYILTMTKKLKEVMPASGFRWGK